MIFRWLPWKFVLKRIARKYGVIDPFAFLARLSRFSQPSEIQVPFELLRAGIAFHARGLINTKAIQNNLDWVWPYWVERQFNPEDASFLPRAFSLTHVNLTQRNWTAVGQPDLPLYPIVDPRGLVTPLLDGWSLDYWIISQDGRVLLPSKLPLVKQEMKINRNICVRTYCEHHGRQLTSSAALSLRENAPVLELNARGYAEGGGWLVVALRPYNPEGVQFIEKIRFEQELPGWVVDSRTRVIMSEPPEKVHVSNYHEGDVVHKLDRPADRSKVTCEVGMATSAALFPIKDREEREVNLSVSLRKELPRELRRSKAPHRSWHASLENAARLQVPDSTIQFLYDAAVRTLILLSGHDTYPGPYTYRRFWFRDACFMSHAILSVGLKARTRRILDTFLSRQGRSGYFCSQHGEWDSNGQVMWVLDRFQKVTGNPLEDEWMKALLKSVKWIQHKRVDRAARLAHAGLFPAGFSAEHLGPNDYYYWDDFWGVAGLRAAARLAGRFHSKEKEAEIFREAQDFEAAVFRSIAEIPERRKRGAIPASPYRRMDSGAIGSLVADYPLQLTPPADPRIRRTVAYLMDNCFHSGGFFQDMIHSGINPYLTLCIAQCLLRAGDSRCRTLIGTVAGLASSTGQWPEAVHPFTGGGCMGDGQHGWAAAEWVMMMRNLFLREEDDRLVLGSGIFPEWLESHEELHFGPTPTPYGDPVVRIYSSQGDRFIQLDGTWRWEPPPVQIQIPGYQRQVLADLNRPYRLVPIS